MLHSPDPARPFQVANTHSWVVSENSDKAIEGATPLIRDRVIWLQTIFQKKSVAALPVVTCQAGETVIAEGSRTGRLLILAKGVVAIVKKDTEIAQVAEPGAVFGELSVLLGKPHTAEVRALETSQFHVANAATLFSQDPIAVLYVAATLAHRLDAANHALIQLKSQLKAGQPNSVVAKTVSKIEGLLAVSGASLVYAGYPFDPFA
jgi:CRP/FNR family cyclic AMP-dependent transcriptional regulator